MSNGRLLPLSPGARTAALVGLAGLGLFALAAWLWPSPPDAWKNALAGGLATLLLVAGWLGRRAGGGEIGWGAAWRREWLGLGEGALVALVVLLPLSLTLPLWGPRFGLRDWPRLPEGWAALCVQTTLLVALPEELFFRGFLQEALDRRWGEPWPQAGFRRLGFGLVLAAALFALAHLAFWRQTWALLVFFPGLLFGLVYARRGSLFGAALLHAACNCAWLTWGG